MKFEEYKEYISGTYENLSFEDRMYYVSFLKEYGRLITKSDENDSIYNNIILFFFECINYLYKKQEFDEDNFVDLHIRYFDNIDYIHHIEYNKTYGVIKIYYESYREDEFHVYEFDYYLMNNEYLHDKMKDKLRFIMNECSENIKKYQKQIEINKKKIDNILCKFRFSEMQGGIEL